MVISSLQKQEDNLFPEEGEVWLVKFEKLKEFSKSFRPCLVISNNVQNEFDKKIIVLPITTESLNYIQPIEVLIQNDKQHTGLDKPSKILCNYPHTIHKQLRLVKQLGIVNLETMMKVKRALKIILNLDK